jgi:hypothetical protein
MKRPTRLETTLLVAIVVLLGGSALGCSSDNEAEVEAEDDSMDAEGHPDDWMSWDNGSELNGGSGAPDEPPGIYWSSWLGDDDSPPRPVERLEADGRRYTVRFDLSRFRYRDAFGGSAADAPLDEGMAAAIRSAIDRERNTLRLLVFPVVGGSGLELADAWQPEDARILVRLDRLADDKEGPGFAEDFQQFVERVAAAVVAIEVVTSTRPGCATIGLSIWADEGVRRPIDHLVRQIPVGTLDETAPPCGTSAEPGTFSASLARALDTNAGVPADAALHVFGDDPTFALFVIGGSDAWGWPLERGMEWLTGKHGLERELAQARSDRQYRRVIRRLTSTLFPGGQSRADHALARLQALADTEAPPVVLAQVVDDRGIRHALPLGLLAAGDGSALGDAIDLVIPMPEERQGPSTGCLERWDRVVPSTLYADGHSSFGGCKADPLAGNAGETWADFEQWMEDSQPDRLGFLLLAHHSPSGGISFGQDEDSPRALPEDLTRSFAPGSVAVLVTCNGATQPPRDAGSATWLKALNSHHVDAAVVSAFSVDVGIGACFARLLAQAIALADQEQPLSSILKKARKTLATDLPDGLDAAAHEFILVGDPEIRICPGSPS